MAKKRHSVFSYIGEYKPLFILAPFLTVLESVAELILPFLMGKIVDNGRAGTGQSILQICKRHAQR